VVQAVSPVTCVKLRILIIRVVIIIIVIAILAITTVLITQGSRSTARAWPPTRWYRPSRLARAFNMNDHTGHFITMLIILVIKMIAIPAIIRLITQRSQPYAVVLARHARWIILMIMTLIMMRIMRILIIMIIVIIIEIITILITQRPRSTARVSGYQVPLTSWPYCVLPLVISYSSFFLLMLIVVALAFVVVGFVGLSHRSRSTARAWPPTRWYRPSRLSRKFNNTVIIIIMMLS